MNSEITKYLGRLFVSWEDFYCVFLVFAALCQMVSLPQTVGQRAECFSFLRENFYCLFTGARNFLCGQGKETLGSDFDTRLGELQAARQWQGVIPWGQSLPGGRARRLLAGHPAEPERAGRDCLCTHPLLHLANSRTVGKKPFSISLLPRVKSNS